MEKDLDETIDAKIENALDNLFNNHDEFKSKVHGAV